MDFNLGNFKVSFEESSIFFICCLILLVSVTISIVSYNTSLDVEITKALEKEKDPIAVMCAYNNSMSKTCEMYIISRIAKGN